jgi:hypothetical protein
VISECRNKLNEEDMHSINLLLIFAVVWFVTSAPAALCDEAPPDMVRPQRWAEMLTSAQYHKFMSLVQSDIQNRGLTPQLHDDYLTIKEFPKDTLGLDNLVRTCAGAGADKWQAAISEHFDGLVATLREKEALAKKLEKFDEAAPLLRPRIYALDAIPADALKQMVTRTDLQGTVTVAVLDLPRALQSVNRAEANLWKKTDAEIFEIAIKNLRANSQLKVTEIPLKDGGKILAMMSKDGFGSSHALIFDQNADAVGKFGTLLAVPARDMTLCHPINDRSVLGSAVALSILAGKMSKDAPGAISSELFWYHEGHFVPVPSEIRDGNPSLRFPKELDQIIRKLDEP